MSTKTEEAALRIAENAAREMLRLGLLSGPTRQQINADISRGWPRIRTMPTAKDAFYSFRIEDEPPKLYMVEMLLKEVVPHA